METKKQFRWFTIFDYDKEQEYLSEMHKSGWRFVKVTGLGTYHFEKCTPEAVSYRLDYNKEGLAHKDEYVKMFNDCGWEYIQEYAGYSYFRKPVGESGVAEEIFCDDDSKLQMMQRVLKGRMLPLLVIFFATLLPQFIINLCSTRNYVIASVIGSILILYIYVFAVCYIKYNSFKNGRKK